MENINEIFDSLSDFYVALENRKLNQAFAKKNREISHHVDEYLTKFTTTKSYQEASDLMLRGDSTNLSKLVAVDGVDLSHIHGTKKVNRQQKSVCGGFPLVPVYLTGVPRNMLASKKITTKTKVISILYNQVASCSVDANDIVSVGAKIVSIIRFLEKNQIRCNLYVSIVSTASAEGGQTISCAVKIKDAGAPLNLLNIAYPLINPSMLRRHMFRWEETKEKVCEAFTRVYGYPRSINKESEICKMIGKNCYVLNCQDLLDKDINQITSGIIKQITI